MIASRSTVAKKFCRFRRGMGKIKRVSKKSVKMRRRIKDVIVISRSAP